MPAQLPHIPKEKITNKGSMFVLPKRTSHLFMRHFLISSYLEERKDVKVNHKGRGRHYTSKNGEGGEAITADVSAIRLAKEKAAPKHLNTSGDSDLESSDSERDCYITTNERGHKIIVKGSQATSMSKKIINQVINPLYNTGVDHDCQYLTTVKTTNEEFEDTVTNNGSVILSTAG
ncbi:hypothetical protein MPER_05826 [Moniliophthora perniciosa FA553]|nr:hypothetical protein MPER_05826 [Moniliophthora perniciosa FA553]